MELKESKIIEKDGAVVKYKEGNRIRQALWETDLTNAELRLFSYFLLKSRIITLKPEKQKQFKMILENGIIPETIGCITKRGNLFCIQQEGENILHFYIGGNDASTFNMGLKKILKRVGK